MSLGCRVLAPAAATKALSSSLLLLLSSSSRLCICIGRPAGRLSVRTKHARSSLALSTLSTTTSTTSLTSSSTTTTTTTTTTNPTPTPPPPMSHMSTRASRRKASEPYAHAHHAHHAHHRQQQQQQTSDSEEITFRGRRAGADRDRDRDAGGAPSRSTDRYQPAGRRDTRPPLPPPPPPPLAMLGARGRSEGGLHARDRSRDARTGPRRELDGPWRSVHQQERQPAARHDDGYGDSTGRGRGYGTGEPARYAAHESSPYTAPPPPPPPPPRAHRAAAGFSEPMRSTSTPDYGRSAPRSGGRGAYNYPTTPASSDGGVALAGQYDGQDYRRSDQWRGSLPPPPPPLPPIPGYVRDDSWRNDDRRFPHPHPPPPIPSSSYRAERPPPYPKTSYPESAPPYAPRDFGSSSREPSRGRGASRDYHTAPPRHDAARRSENRYPPPPPPTHPSRTYSSAPTGPRGPLSSARFRQGIDKHSRYTASAPPLSHKPFPPTHPSAKAGRGKKTPHYERPPRPDKEHRPSSPHGRGKMSAPPPPPPAPRSDNDRHHTPHEPEHDRRAKPAPTPEYLSLSQQPPTRLPAATAPRSQLLILDLNGTLLARKCGRAKSGSISPTARPGLRSFLAYIFQHFSVMVWSSARADNVGLMLRALFAPAQRARLVAEWARDTLGLSPAEFARKVQVYKRLDRVWGGQHRVPGGWAQENTLLLDDSPAKALAQPHNHVEVSEFLGTAREVREDRVLVALVGYLEEVRWQGNVSAYIRAAPFAETAAREGVGRRVLAGFGYEEVVVAEKRVEVMGERRAEEEAARRAEKKARKKERKREKMEAQRARAAARDEVEVEEVAVADVEGLEAEAEADVEVEVEYGYSEDDDDEEGGR